MTGKDGLPEKDFPEKDAAEYSLLGKALKEQRDIAKKQYQGLDKAFIPNKDNKNVNESLI